MDLFPHNREAYENAIRLFKKENRACIIQPTGTGKSLIIAEFINRHHSQRHLVLAPGTHIFREVEKYITGGDISFSTYTGVKTNQSLFVPHSFDFIYLDEFHRLGADVWGNNVDRLLQMNPRGKVLGTSATPIRYLDDNRNMATEIFNGRIATQMSLNYAIAGGILPTPTYVSSLYSIKDELHDMKRKILSSDSKEKNAMIRDLDAKMIDWERSSGFDRVIKKHLSPDRRRVIVFCKDWNHLKRAQNILDPVFKDIYGPVRSYSLYSKNKGSDNEACLKLFSEDDPRPVILYSIDKVNEGLHSKNCNTVILLRGTISPIVFYQQIGRAFSIKGAFRPLIIDLVNNFKNSNLESFKRDFEQALKSSARKRRLSDREQIKKIIEFIDETQDVRNIFSAFEEKIDNWTPLYKKAKRFYEQHGHIYVPPAERELCYWVRRQRNDLKKRAIATHRIPLLKAIGMEITADITAQWLMRYHELQQWIKDHGELPTVSKNAVLSAWIMRQRCLFDRGRLNAEQVRLLQPLIPLGGNRIRLKLEARMERLLAHFKNGDIYSANEQIRNDLFCLRDTYLNNKLPENDLLCLRKGNVPVELTMNDFEWLKKVKKAIEWYKTHGKLPTRSENSGLRDLWTREEKYINTVHFYAKFISLSEDAERSVNELQRIICAVRKSRSSQGNNVLTTRT